MENKLSYDEFMKALRSNKISSIAFYVEGYNHYRNCKIWNDGTGFQIKLTVDGSEWIGFYKKFEENYKLFKITGKGKFTLKQMWPQIRITQISYAPPPSPAYFTWLK